MEKDHPPNMADAVIAAQTLGLTKIFAGRKVVQGVDLEIRAGAVHALLGANGSGKLTVVKLLTGVISRMAASSLSEDARWRRSLRRAPLPRSASRSCTKRRPSSTRSRSPNASRNSAATPLRPDSSNGRSSTVRSAPCWSLSIWRSIRPPWRRGPTAAERALIAIIIALDGARSDVKLLILDEVTAALPRNQAEPYLERVAALARSGIGVLTLNHRLAELHGRASKATVLRGGTVAYEADAEHIDEDRLVKEMVGPAKAQAKPSSASLGAGGLRALGRKGGPTPSGETALSVHGLEGAMLRDLSFHARRGEIVGAAGLGDSGVAELPRILAGLEAPTGGSISVGGKPVPPRATPRTLIRAGLVVLPADRLRSGGVAPLSVAENIPLARSRAFLVEAPSRGRIHRADHRAVRREAGVGRNPLRKAQRRQSAEGDPRRMACAETPGFGARRPHEPASTRALGRPSSNCCARPPRTGSASLLFSTEPEQLAAFCSRVLILEEGEGRLRAHRRRGPPPNHQPLVLRMTQETDRPTGLPLPPLCRERGWIGRT